MSKRFSILFTLMLLFQTITSSLVLPSQIHAEGTNKQVITGITVTDESGNLVDADTPAASAVQVGVDWSVVDMDVAEGSTESIVIPSEITFEQDQSGVLNFNDVEVGSFAANVDGVITVTFHEAIGAHQDAQGSFSLDAVVAGSPTDEASEPEADVDQEEAPGDEEEKASEEVNKEEDSVVNEADSVSDEQEAVAEEEMESGDEAEEAPADTKKEKTDNKRSDSEKDHAQAVADGEKQGFQLTLGQVTDLDGNPFTEENLLDPREEFWLKLDWTLENGHNYKAGDTEIFELPKGIKIIQEMTGELLDASGQLVATYIITTDKKVELTFTDFVETHSNVKGWIEIISTLDEQKVEIEDGEAILDPIGEEGELRIPIEEGSKEKTIEKKGTPNKGYNADEINWEVIINKNKTSLNHAYVTDVLPEGTEYKEGSLKITKLKVDLYGNILGDLEEVEGIEVVVDEEGNITIPLGDIQDAYRIEYVTTVTDDDEKHFSNHATLSDDELEHVSAEASVTINRGEAIKKKAAKSYDPKTGIIEWEIEFNYNEKSLENVTLSDAWTPAGKIDFVEGSLVFTEMDIDEHGNAHETGKTGLPEGATVEPGTDGFEVTGITTDRAYKVTYQTKVKERVLDPFEVVNTAGFGTESDGEKTGIGTYYGSKSAGTIDYQNKTIDWTIIINQDEFPMEKISITDTLSPGLTLKEDSLQITVGDATYKEYELTGKNPFTISFSEDFTTNEVIIITYQTFFDADEVLDNEPNRPVNHAAITWTPEGGNESITKEVEAGTDLNTDSKNNHWKNGSYHPATKEITWTIYVNYRENDFDHLILKDAPQGNQTIVADSVVVKELAIEENGAITEGEPLDPNGATVNEDNTLEVDIGPTNKAYKITYRTSISGLSDIQKEYVNEASVWDGSEKLSDLHAKVGIAKSDIYGEKSGYQDGKQVHWSVNVNLGQQKITNLKLEDTISENQEYLADTIKVYHANVDVNGHATKGEEVATDDYELTHTSGDHTFTIEWKEEVERAFIVEYSTLFFEKHNGEVTNNYKVTGDNMVDDAKTDGGGSVIIEQLTSGGGSGEAGYLVIDKVDVTFGQEETKLAGAVFDLIDKDTGNVLKTGTTDENGHIDFGRLLFGEYVLEERVVPEGYVTPEESQVITINEIYDPEADKQTYAYTVENYQPVFEIELEKVDDLGALIPGVTFELYSSDDELVATQTTDENGKLSFENLPKAGTYYVIETDAPIGYQPGEGRYVVEVGAKEKEPVTITVENQRELTSVHGLKEWEDGDNQDGIRPESIIVNLLANGEIVDSTEVTAANGWKYSFTNLPKYEDEKEIEYTVEEAELDVDGYTSVIDGFHIINSYTPEVIDVSGVKTWDDADNQDGVRPASIMVNLLANGEVVDSVDVTAEDDWTYRFKNLPKYEAGEEIVYTVTENAVPDYTTEIEGTNITNHHTPGQTSVTVTKNWQDAQNQDGKRVEVIEVQLTADGEAVGNPVVLNPENNWTHTWAGLDEKVAGKTIVYSVVELTEVPEYETSINDEDRGNIIITNAYTPEKTEVSGTKTWIDAENVDGDRPASIVVNLLANDEVVDSVEVTAADHWEYSFTNLPKYQAGKAIVYTVSEEAVAGYETMINGFDIVNARAGSIAIEGTKTWLDDNAKDRPASIVVNLLQNGEVIDSMKVTAETDWKYSFTDLEQYDKNGAAYVYTIEEEAVEGYETTIDGYDITNVRVGTTAVEGTKTWKDDNAADRPDMIKINLLQNGVVIATKEVTAETDWKYSFTDLEKYDESGVAYDYAVKEHAVPGYKSEVNGFNITNTLSDQTSVVVTKGWKDDEAKDRPDAITVHLLQNGKVIDTVEVTAENNWTYEFTDLEAYDDNGVAYVYTVEEEAVEGYETIIDGHDITNLRVGTISVEGTKTWVDDNSNERPGSIVVELLQNGEKLHEVEVTAADDWKYRFTDLPEFDENGKAYMYTVKEQPVAGYISTVDGYDITNTLESLIPVDEETSGEKTPDHNDGQKDPGKEVPGTLDSGNKLPKTATDIFNLLALGIGLLVVGFATRFAFGRKEKPE